MPVTSGQIITRGLTNRCPNCGSRTLFARWFKPNERCPACGMVFERPNDGFFLGAAVINYTVTCVLMLVPVLVLVFMQRLDVLPAVVFAMVWCLAFPAVFHHCARSLWLMTYYLVFPRQLPANEH